MKGKTDITIVTAFFNIGRGKIKNEVSKNLKRGTEIYFDYFSFLAELDNDMIIFTEERYKEKIHPKEKQLYQILEKKFNIKDIEIVLRYLTYNLEFGNYEIDKKYNLTNVDNILDKLSKMEGISEEEWLAREGNQNNKVFENEADSIFGFIYLLKNNKILITGKNNKILKEIKITDYKNTDMAIYKGIFYIYDDGKIYEYLLENLNEVKRYDVN